MTPGKNSFVEINVEAKCQLGKVNFTLFISARSSVKIRIYDRTPSLSLPKNTSTTSGSMHMAITIYVICKAIVTKLGSQIQLIVTGLLHLPKHVL